MRRPHHPRGFSFAEVMFAVAILGIGFIMVASIFPVAIQQTISTADESNAAQFARDVVGTIQSNTTADDYPDDGGNATQPFVAVSAPSQLYNHVVAALINPADTRYAAVPYYSRTGTDGSIRVTVVVVRRAIRTTYDHTDLAASGGTLLPRNVTINAVRPGDGGLLLELAKDPAGNYLSVAPNAFLVVESASGSVGGKTLRVAELRSETDTAQFWVLTPDSAVSPDDDYTALTAGVIGRDFKDPTNPTAGYDGPAQDVAVYTTFIRPN